MGSWTYKQGVKAVNVGPSTPSVTITGVTVGNLLFCGISNFSTSLSSVSDGSNTWNLLNSGTLAGFYAVVTTGGSLTISAASCSDWAIGVVEFSPGGGTIAKAGAGVPAATSGSSQTPLSGNYTVTVPCLGVGYFSTSTQNSNTWSTNGNWVADPNSSSNFASGNNFGLGISYWLSATPSPIAGTISLASSASWHAEVAGFTSTGGSVASASMAATAGNDALAGLGALTVAASMAATARNDAFSGGNRRRLRRWFPQLDWRERRRLGL